MEEKEETFVHDVIAAAQANIQNTAPEGPAVDAPEAQAPEAPEAQAEEEEPLWADVKDTCSVHHGSINGRDFSIYPGLQIVTPEVYEALKNADLLK